ncbi:MAG: cupin domain-containing protein [Verrucomicrobiota bacterium]
MLKGSVKVSAGKNSAELGEGDVIVYQCDIDHSIENISTGEAQIHLVVRFAKG